MTTLEQLRAAVTAGKSKDARALTTCALEEGIAPTDVVDQALVPAMTAVGEAFKNDQIFVPEMLVAARAMKESMHLLEPRLAAAGVVPRFTAVIGTVSGDLHDIGKNLVAMMWKGAQFKVIDLGTNVAPERFVAAVREHQPHIVGLSALLTTTMPAMQTTVQVLRQAGTPSVKILVGGAPVTAHFATAIGADGYAADAATAVDTALQLVR